MVFSKNKSLPIVPFFTVKLPWPEYFMAVKSIFDIKCFKDVKFVVEQSVLHLNIYKSETISKNTIPSVCQQKILSVYVLSYFTHCMKVACWNMGDDVQQPKNPGSKPVKYLFYQMIKLMTVMKFSRTNLLNCFVFCASLI